ncbi:PREDICTED: NADH dehydrogenase [ubiquinone] 1 beta subcomplex subunit 1 [Condylura cristata]|uniref:NADH dehydrogenase [ubiquinone] 1 beta subcomplex subunit 1 n=1 Tax=Condylura cristata TaxID=143302 RepID=UPI0006436DB3|nr:PREDICTED: NADH dehydrogenase [ubiquinone] 1 beta subcomplex subunit 1 [Condylura cristata]
MCEVSNGRRGNATRRDIRGLSSRRHPSVLRGRGEWHVPRRPLPPALGAGLAAALGRWVVVGFEAAASTMNLLQMVRDHWVHVLVPMGFVLGCYLDRKNDEKLTAFRNKSMLFKRELRPNEEVTWK